MNEYIAILVMASSKKEAEAIAEALVEARLVACANILEGIDSVFRWEGKIRREREVLMIVKSRSELFDDIAQRVRDLHSYEVPEILAIPILKGFGPYLAWLESETRREE